ncbi:MAG: polyprenyl synthetase family protein [Promethearchaeia archaeon]
MRNTPLDNTERTGYAFAFNDKIKNDRFLIFIMEEFLKREKRFVNKKLNKYFNRIAQNESDSLFKDFLSELRTFIVNEEAKRIHPILLIAAYSGIVNPMYLEDYIDEIRNVSIAVELLHSGNLIFDDLIDDDTKRRGKPTFHVQLGNQVSETYKSLNLQSKNMEIDLYGRDLGILGGNYGYILGLDILKSGKFPPELKLKAINEYTTASNYLIKGQIIEEYMSYQQQTMTLEQYLEIAEMQRARMFEKSTTIGAILAKGNIHYQIKPLSKAMVKMGQAYAIRDDIADMKKDIKAKEKRFLYILAVQKADEEQSKLNEIYRKPELSNEDIQTVERIFRERQVVKVAKQFSQNLVNQAKSSLKEIYPDLNKEQIGFFNEFLDYI